MTREEAKKIALDMIDKEIKESGGDDSKFFLMSPRVGKCAWTFKEARESVINDTPLEELDENPIDMILDWDDYAEKHNLNRSYKKGN